MSAVPTVKIVADDYESGFVVINQDEFDAEKHALFSDAPSDDAKRKAPATKTKPSEA